MRKDQSPSTFRFGENAVLALPDQAPDCQGAVLVLSPTDARALAREIERSVEEAEEQ